MNKAYNKKVKKLLVLSFLFISLILVNFGMILITDLHFNNEIDNNTINRDNNVNKIDEGMPEASQALNYSGSGKLVDVLVHQSLVDTTSKQFSNLDVSHTFSEPFPKFSGFNSSFINMTLDNIYAPNKTLVVEDQPGGQVTVSQAYYTSFQVPGDCDLNNLSIQLFSPAGLDIFYFDVFGAQNYLGNPKFDLSKDLTGIGVNLGQHSNDSTTPVWFTLTGLDQFLNVSKTYNNYFFIKVSTSQGLGMWRYEDTLTNGDDTYSYDSTQASDLSLTDLTLKVGLSPVGENIANASDISLRVNGTAVSDIKNGKGYWNPTQTYSSPSNQLEFNITADWFAVSCDVTSVQVNYTKTDIKATSSFDIIQSGDVVQWNVTVPTGLNYFDDRITDYNVINFTIPRIWDESTIKVFNGPTEKTSDIKKRLIDAQYREIQVLNAGNGTYWYLTANSSNLLSSIDTYINNIPISPSNIANFSSLIEFNATFSESVSNGLLNLSVYSPIPRFMNDTILLDISSGSPGSEIFVDNWDVSQNITDYGVFLVLMSWNNDTAAGFLEGYLTIFSDTEIITTLPRTTFNASNVFDIGVFYNDTGQKAGVEDATLTYKINDGSVRSDITQLGNGYYNITVDCNDSDFVNYGDNMISLNISKQYYNNQTDSITIRIIGETNSYILDPLDGSVFDSSDTFNVTIFYNNTVRDVGINNAFINYSLNGGLSYRHDNIFALGSGKYNISISASDPEFNGYGIKTIIVNSSKQYYYNQSNSISIKILGVTSPLTTIKIPDKTYYNSAETFNISIYYEDPVKSEGISGATIEIDVNGTPYSPMVYDNHNGWYNITIDCSDAIFNSYGNFGIGINASKHYYYNQTTSVDTIIVGEVSLTHISPAYNSVYVDGDTFVVRVQYYDNIQSVGISGATVNYSLNDGASYKSTNCTDNLDGTYDIAIYANDTDFLSYGFVDIIINVSKPFYENASITYTFHRQIQTSITPGNDIDLGSVRRGQIAPYKFYYNDSKGNSINDANATILDASGFTWQFIKYGNGTYTMSLDSTTAAVMSDHIFIFEISAVGNETQTIQITIDVTIIQTDVQDISFLPELARNSGLNQSIRFYFNDTTNSNYVPGVKTGDVVLKNNDTGTSWGNGFYWLEDNWDNGTYILQVDMGTRNAGWYTLQVNISKFPDYDVSMFYVTFYFRGNYTNINLISIADPGGDLTPVGKSNYTIFEGSDLNVEFNFTDTEFSDSLIIGDANAYWITYVNLDTSAQGVLLSDFHFITQSHVGTIFTSNPALTSGRYLINLTVSKLNYENSSFAFNITVIQKYQVRLTSVSQPSKVNAGDDFTLILKAEYFNGVTWMPLEGSDIHITPYFNGVPASDLNPISTNSTGESKFVITVSVSARNMNLTVFIQSAYNHQGNTIYVADIKINPTLTIEDFLIYIIIGVIALAAVGGSVAIYRGIVVPKKREKQRILNEVKTIFDDAINLEHVLVLYKGTGTCIFFKSYGSEEIDPELIGGFLTAVSSFGKEMVAQEALNEISYGDKMLLLADGEFIRVALVLGKKASLILRKHLKEFIDAFEKTYNEILPKWRGQLNHFRNAGEIVDDLLNTSIILPHQISYDFADIKDLKNPHSREILKVAQSCCEEADRKFFFIATLLKDASEKTNKDTAEIFMGIKELRDKRILLPIEISAIEAQPVSQQEINLINQKVAQIANLSNEEKQKLVSDLAQLGPAEREAYLASLTEYQEIVSAPIKSKVGEKVIEDKKSAKKEIKILTKSANSLKSKKDYEKSLETYQRAAVIASNWELTTMFNYLQESIRKTTIEELQKMKKVVEIEAKDFQKKSNYEEAAKKYKEASKIASQIFKLGVNSMMKEVKNLTNKANELEKLK